MKIKVKIPKDRLSAPMDFGELLTSHKACGVNMSYNECPFMQFESAKAVLFDAYSAAHKYKPFAADIGAIGFPFYCNVLTEDGERVAYCGLRLSEARAVKWQPVLDKVSFGRLVVDPDAASIPITSGVCCMADEQAYELYVKHIKDELHPLDGLIVLNGQTHTQVELYGKKFAVFSTGWGDGMYKSYMGLDENGKTVAIVVDFGMIEYPTSDNTLTEVEIEYDENTYIYDPTKSESDNNIARWTHALEHTATDPMSRMQAYSRRGYAYHIAHNYDAALRDYFAAMECCKKAPEIIAPSMAWSVYDNATEILCERSDYETAIRIMTEALEADDGFYSSAFVKLIDMYQLTKRGDKALDIAERMIKKRPDDPVAYIKYAECLVSALDYSGAAQSFDKLAAEFRLNDYLFDEASCLIALGEHEKAEEVLEKHPTKDQYEQYWYYKAYIDFKERRFGTALEYAETSHALDGEYMPALYLLIDIETALNEFDAVAEYAEEYKKLRPYTEYGYSVCAEANLMLGKFTECAHNYAYLYSNIRGNDKYAALAAVVYGATGEKQRGVKLLRMLKRKHSKYYYGALFCAYITKYRASAALDRVINKLRGDSEFLLLLAAFLFQTNNIVFATKLLGSIDDKTLKNEIVALQIRIADKIGDVKQFNSFFDYYVEHFFAPNMPESEKRALKSRFISPPHK